MSLPYMTTFVSDHIADTAHLTCEERGAYFHILLAMWQRNGAVPDDDKDLARITGLTIRRWRQIKKRLDPLLSVNEAGEITQARLYKELLFAHKLTAKQRALARSRWNKNNDLASSAGMPPIPIPIYKRGEVSPRPETGEPSQKKNGLQRRQATKAQMYSQPQFKPERPYTMHDDETKAKNLAKIARDSVRPMYRPSLKREEQLAAKVEADVRKWLGDEAYQIIVDAVTEKQVASAVVVESRHPGKGFRALAAFAGIPTWRWPFGEPLPYGVHGPHAPAQWVH